MSAELPDYQLRKLAKAFNSYGLAFDEYSLKDHIHASPDKEFFFFMDTATPGVVTVFLIEDYIGSLDYVKGCFTDELNASLVELYWLKVVKKPQFEERDAVAAADVYQPQEDWEELRKYAVDFSPYFFGFLAQIKPLHPKSFWQEIKKLQWN